MRFAVQFIHNVQFGLALYLFPPDTSKLARMIRNPTPRHKHPLIYGSSIFWQIKKEGTQERNQNEENE